MRLVHLACVIVLLASAQGGRAGETAWVSSQMAQDYLSSALPRVTKENPRYLTKADGVLSEWLTESLRFTRQADHSLRVDMFETFRQTRAGITTPGKHEASFALAEVDISEFAEAGDVTPNGDASRGVMFACRIPGCIAARWNSEATRAANTDISVQESAARTRILSAFIYLQDHSE